MLLSADPALILIPIIKLFIGVFVKSTINRTDFHPDRIAETFARMDNNTFAVLFNSGFDSTNETNRSTGVTIDAECVHVKETDAE